MATAAVDEDEDVLTCTVCLDSYTDPCSLQCKHSFCRKCITDYVKTQADAVQNKTIPCPSCRQVTRVPDPSRPVDEWAGQLLPGHAVQGLMATANKDETVQDTPCFPCQQIGETTPGLFWCSECEAVLCQRCARPHSVMPNCRDHDLCDLKDKGQSRRRKARCSKHGDKQLELYCKNCNIFHCQLCFVANHRRCEDVVVLESFVTDMKTELSELHQQLEQQEKKTRNLVEHGKTRISHLNGDKIALVDEIRSSSQKAVDLIKEKEKKLIDQVDEITNRETNEAGAKVKQGCIQMQTYRQYSEYIKQALSSDTEVEVCDVYQAWKSGQMEISQEGEEKMGGGNISSVRFSQQNQNIAQVINSLHLGEIITTYPPTDLLSYPVLSESVDTRVEEDKGNPNIHDLVVLEVGGDHTAVVTDYNNTCIKSFYTSNNKRCHSRLQLNNNPWGITQLGDDKVMVAVPDSKQIVTVAVTPDLVHLTHINTSKSYLSLTVISPSTLAAGGYGYVDILNMQGEVMRSVSTHNNMPVFKYPWYMTVSNTGHLLVSDWEKKTVTCLTSEGEVVWIYSGTGGGQLTNLRGITSTDGGDILVVDNGLKKVIQLSESGMYVRDVLSSQDGLKSPDGVYLNKHGSLFICDSGKFLKFEFFRK